MLTEEGSNGHVSRDQVKSQVLIQLGRRYQYYLDKTVVHLIPRWIGNLVLLSAFWLRVYLSSSHHIVTYGLHIYLLNLLIGFLTPAVDPEMDQNGPSLPTTSDDEFKPFSRRLPEFKFWYACFKGIVVSLSMTFFAVFDVPVFWPILLGYFVALFVLTMRRQIAHMIKHRYIPCSFGKKVYKTKDALHV